MLLGKLINYWKYNKFFKSKRIFNTGGKKIELKIPLISPFHTYRVSYRVWVRIRIKAIGMGSDTDRPIKFQIIGFWFISDTDERYRVRVRMKDFELVERHYCLLMNNGSDYLYVQPRISKLV